MPSAESLVDALADSLADINVKTLGHKLVHVEAEELRGDQETWQTLSEEATVCALAKRVLVVEVEKVTM